MPFSPSNTFSILFSSPSSKNHISVLVLLWENINNFVQYTWLKMTIMKRETWYQVHIYIDDGITKKNSTRMQTFSQWVLYPIRTWDYYQMKLSMQPVTKLTYPTFWNYSSPAWRMECAHLDMKNFANPLYMDLFKLVKPQNLPTSPKRL